MNVLTMLYREKIWLSITDTKDIFGQCMFTGMVLLELLNNEGRVPAASANFKVPPLVHSPRELWPLPSDEPSARNQPMSHLSRCKIHHIHTPNFPSIIGPARSSRENHLKLGPGRAGRRWCRPS